MKDAGIRVPLGWGNQAALGVAEVSIRERGFRTRDGGAGGFATGPRAGAAAGFAAAGTTALFGGAAGRGPAARAVLDFAGLAGLAGFAAFLACGFA